MDIEELRVIMNEIGWSARKLARVTNLHYNTVHYMLNGKNYTMKTYRKCQEVLYKALEGGCDEDYSTDTE